MGKTFLVARREYLAYITAWGFWVGLLITPVALLLGITIRKWYAEMVHTRTIC